MPASATPSNIASANINSERVLVLDFGAQYVQLIARRVREQHVYCEIVRHDITAERIRELAPKGIILSGSAIQRFLNSVSRSSASATACS
jgi:GMP synthase (glutamine-hydrolysing)